MKLLSKYYLQTDRSSITTLVITAYINTCLNQLLLYNV